MKSIRRAAGSTAVLALLALVMPACGAMEAKPQAPAAEPSPAPAAPPAAAPVGAEAAPEDADEPTNLADAEARLEKARAELNRLAFLAPQPSPAAAEAAAPGRPSSSLPAPAREEARRADKAASVSAADDAGPPPAKLANSCETACKAFASLTRASEAVCRLDADGGQRCERARHIREDASQRVASCGCAK